MTSFLCPKAGWVAYVNLGYLFKGVKERFGSDIFQDPMKELVSLKQQGIVDQFHDKFVSLLNQIRLLETYALSIFVSNLRIEIGQYLKLFKPKNLVDGYLIARQVENILGGNPKKHKAQIGGVGYPKTLFPGHNGESWGIQSHLSLVLNCLVLLLDLV